MEMDSGILLENLRETKACTNAENHVPNGILRVRQKKHVHDVKIMYQL